MPEEALTLSRVAQQQPSEKTHFPYRRQVWDPAAVQPVDRQAPDSALHLLKPTRFVHVPVEAWGADCQVCSCPLPEGPCLGGRGGQVCRYLGIWRRADLMPAWHATGQQHTTLNCSFFYPPSLLLWRQWHQWGRVAGRATASLLSLQSSPGRTVTGDSGDHSRHSSGFLGRSQLASDSCPWKENHAL